MAGFFSNILLWLSGWVLACAYAGSRYAFAHRLISIPRLAEADASFQVRTSSTSSPIVSRVSSKYPKFECKLEISQRRQDHQGYDNLDFLNYIAEFLETQVKKIRSDKPKPEYRVRTTSLKGNIKAKNYLLQFPLFGTKHLDSLDWMKVVDMFDKKEHITDEGKEKIVKIKSGMNNFRTNFTWDHLQNFYNLKI